MSKHQLTTIKKLTTIGNSKGVILPSKELKELGIEEGDELFIKVQKAPSKEKVLDYVWDKLDEERIEELMSSDTEPKTTEEGLDDDPSGNRTSPVTKLGASTNVHPWTRMSSGKQGIAA